MNKGAQLHSPSPYLRGVWEPSGPLWGSPQGRSFTRPRCCPAAISLAVVLVPLKPELALSKLQMQQTNKNPSPSSFDARNIPLGSDKLLHPYCHHPEPGCHHEAAPSPEWPGVVQAFLLSLWLGSKLAG